MIGPGASREWPGSYSSGPVQLGGGGLPWKRTVLGFGLLLMLLANLPSGGPAPVSADSWSLPNVSCTNNTVTLAQVPVQGYDSGWISFHLKTQNGGSFLGRWQHSSGYTWPMVTFSAGLSGPGEWWATGQPSGAGGIGTYYGALGFSIAPNSTGTMSFVIGKAADYGTCFTVDSINLVLVRSVATSSGVPPSNNGAPGSPGYTDSPPPSLGSYNACEPGTLPGNCPSPPPGYCWVQNGQYFPAVSWDLVPCAAASPVAAPSAGPNATLSCAFSQQGHAWGPWSSQSGSFTFRPGDVVTGIWTGSAAGSYQFVVAYLSPYPTNAVRWAGGSGAAASGGPFEAGTYFYSGPTIPASVTSQWTYTGPNPVTVWLVCEGTGSSTTGSFTLQLFVTAGPDQSAAPSYNPFPSPSGWPSYPPLPTFGGFGSFPPFSWPSYPPFSWPSYPPLWSPDPSAAPGGVNICPTNGAGATPPIAACAQASGPVPSGPGTSFAVGIPDASGAVSGFDQLRMALSSKVPFGYAAQAVTALTGAAGSAAGGGTLDECVSMSWWHAGGTSDTDLCIPWDSMATAASAIRFVLLAVLMIGFAGWLIGVARSTAAGGN